jgi:FixJ family two-component response regulator
MPGVSGSEMIRKMRKLRPAIPTMVVSGYLSAAIVRRAREAGASEVLKKPLSAHGLARSLTRVLHAKQRTARRTAGTSASRSGSAQRG